MPTFAITYVYSSDSTALDSVRPAHRAYLQALVVTGAVVASGPVKSGDMAGALIIVRAVDTDAAMRLLEHDPFFQQGLVLDRAIVEWNIVLGEWAQ